VCGFFLTRITAGAGDDRVIGGASRDRIYGGRGADMFGSLGTQDERKDLESDEGDYVQATFGGSSYYGGSFLYGPEVMLRDLGHK
jgi:hypothetical protein